MACFYDLPAELHFQIFDYLHPSDVKSARAVSKKFRDNATPSLFCSIVACPRYQALGAYQNVSLHSIYSGYVKELVFDGTMYDAQLACNERAYYEAEGRLENPELYRNWSSRTRWKRYQDLYRDQKDMTDDKVLLQSLARGLESMQNISSIVYSPRQHLIPTERKDLKNLLARGSCQGRDHGSRITTWNHPFRELIGAVFLSQYTRIRELTIERTPVGIDEPSTQFSLSIFTFPDSNDVKAGRHLFRHLIRLDLNVSLEKPGARASPALGHVLGGGPGTMFGNHTGVFHNPYMQAPPGWLGPHQPPPVGGAAAIPAPVSPIGPHPVGQAVHAAGVHSFGFTYGSSSKESIRQLQNLTRCLRAAQDLRYLSLCIPHWSDSAREMYGHIFPDGRPIFHSLGLWITWPMLRSLSLEGIHADERDLIDLVKRHRDTLRVLDFSKCSLCMGTWAKVIDEVVENASMISSFTLKEVNDAVRIRNLDNDDGENWRYEGHLVVAENGEREFVRT